MTKFAAADRATLLRRLIALGIPVEWRPSGETATFSFRYEGDVRLMSVDALGDPWTADEASGWVCEAIGRAEWIHVGPLARSDFPADTVAVLARGEFRLSAEGR